MAISNLAVRNHCAVRSERSPLHDVIEHATCRRFVEKRGCKREFHFLWTSQTVVRLRIKLRRTTFAVQRLACQRSGDGREGWWSQTGSNRRPPACKAGALPAELWPLFSGALKWNAACRAEARGNVPAFALWAPAWQPLHRIASKGWWAWEDLNFRPHAYQARALTN